MTRIYAFLQKRKLSEHQYGIYMVVMAYVLSFLLLFLGSDVFYNINTTATGIMDRKTEETQKEQLIGSKLEQLYHPETGVTAKEMAADNPLQVFTGDTYWLFGYAMDENEYQLFIEKLNNHISLLRKEEQLAVLSQEVTTGNDEEPGEELIAAMTATDTENGTDTSQESAAKSNKIESLSVSTDSNVMDVTAEEVEMLERIVEAEATGEDMKGKILVANVVFNRALSDEFPDTIEEVIFQESDGNYQFSPVEDKRFWKVKITEETKEAVQRALEGEDYSQGALYFMARKRTRKSSAKWFDENLEWLFKHGGHEFYKEK